MGHSFVAYIDESGDDGVGNFRVPGARGGMSRWLAISACVFRQSNDQNAIAWRDEIIAAMPGKKKRELHFKELKHPQRVVAATVLAGKPVRSLNVLSDKTTIADGVYREKNQLYFYLTRYLMERVSWLCRDYRRFVPEGDGTVKIIFSRRGSMSYLDFQAYMRRLQQDDTVTIYWPVIDIDGIEAHDHSRRAGLQLADIVTGSFVSGLEPNMYGHCEARYAEILKPTAYCRNRNYFSYGVKLVPSIDGLQLSQDQQRFTTLFS